MRSTSGENENYKTITASIKFDNKRRNILLAINMIYVSFHAAEISKVEIP